MASHHRSGDSSSSGSSSRSCRFLPDRVCCSCLLELVAAALGGHARRRIWDRRARRLREDRPWLSLRDVSAGSPRIRSASCADGSCRSSGRQSAMAGAISGGEMTRLIKEPVGVLVSEHPKLVDDVADIGACGGGAR